MFQFRFLLLIVLIPLAGILGLLGGTSAVHGVVMAPYDAAVSTTAAALRGSVVTFANQTVDAAARAASDKDVHAALTGKKMTPAAEAALLGPAGSYGAPSFALVVSPDGTVVVKAGADGGLPSPLSGLPVVAEALTGVARDGLWIQGDKPVHLVAAAMWDGNAVAGGVVLGWPFTPELATTLGRVAGTPTFIVGAASVIGASGDVDVAALAKRTPFGEPTPSFGPLPVLLPDTFRYTITGVPLYANDTSFQVLSVIDRDAAFAGIASLQAGILGLTALLGLLVLVIVVMTMSGVKRPLDIILDHLAQVQQGNNVGILPETGLSGPFLRLGKQINMILQAMPSSARPGAPVAPMGFGSPAFDTAPLSSSSGMSSGFPTSPSSNPSSFPSSPPVSTPPVESFDPGFKAGPPTFVPPPPTAVPASGSGPTAASPSAGLAGLFDEPDPLKAFRVPPKAATPPPQPAPPPEPTYDAPDMPSHEMQPEATVMFQVPQSLLAASAVEAPKPKPPAPRVDDNRTVVAQVPQELLAQVAPKNDVDAADEAHYKEVYEKFVQTRIECGEDTSDLSYERFVAKLLKNRQQIVEKHKAKSVRFQVYVKDGKAALRALPVRD